MHSYKSRWWPGLMVSRYENLMGKELPRPCAPKRLHFMAVTLTGAGWLVSAPFMCVAWRGNGLQAFLNMYMALLL
jgi:hypothetical protein